MHHYAANGQQLTMQLQCKNCKNNFTITSEDKKFYARIDVPEPTLCPDCRTQRRMVNRNERVLYPRQCMSQGCSNEFETTYGPNRSEIVYCEECYQKEI